MSSGKRPIAIIGAGLTGCFLATLLAKRGYNIVIYERAAREGTTASASKRSFYLTFRRYAQRVVQEAGLWDKVAPHTLSLKGFMTDILRSPAPIVTFIDEKKDPCFAIGRSVLLEVLLSEAMSYPNVEVRFNTALVDIEYAEKVICVQSEGSAEIERMPVDAVLGADGVHSATRTAMHKGIQAELFEEYADWSYKQILISKELAQQLGLEQDIAHTWTRPDAVIISHPGPDGSHVALLALPDDLVTGFATLTSPDAIRKFVAKEFPSLLPALSVIIESVLHNPKGSFVTVRTSPWHREGLSAILGDAAHAFYPFFGQGVSAGFGDAVELVRLIDEHNGDWSAAFPLYEKNRKVHMDTLAELSKKGFALYKRSSRADYEVIYERFETLLYSLMPTLICPPLEYLITQDPGKAADYVALRKKLRKATTYIGAPVLVGIVTVLVLCVEMVGKVFKGRYHDDAQRIRYTSKLSQ